MGKCLLLKGKALKPFTRYYWSVTVWDQNRQVSEQALAGINVDPAQPGFKNILLKPHFVADLDYVKASYKSPFGLIVSEWTRKQGKVEYKVVIPPGATATLYLDGKGEAKQLSSGTYKFNI